MKSLIPSQVNGHKEELRNWHDINWNTVNKILRNLQRRIFRARKFGQWKQLRRLQKLLFKSYANLLKSVRQITQENKGKNTPGVDKEVINTPEQRVKLINSWIRPDTKPTRRVYIPKSNGKKRPLGIPTVRDRVAQNMVKRYLEPEWEAVFEAHSYGFRPGRSCHDAISQVFNRTNKGNKAEGDTWVLDADIKGYFDNLRHETILKELNNVTGISLIKEWLEAGFVYKGKFESTDSGTPQGGVISPLLANIGLHGLEKEVKTRNSNLGIIRYADDFVITAKSKKEIEEILPVVEKFLLSRGLELSKEKTKVVHTDEGFDYLGFNIRRYRKGKLFIRPQKSKVLKKCKEIGKIINENKSAKQENLIAKLNPILRGFANYYRGVVSKQTFSYMQHRIWRYIWKWCKRRHPKKGTNWVKNTYFKIINGVDWIFQCSRKDRKGNDIPITLFNIEKTSIIRHIKIRGTASPYDGELKEYWEKRNAKEGKQKWVKNSTRYKLAIKQNYKCQKCGDTLFNGEEVETHHIIPVVQGGKDDIGNLELIHKVCHKQVHKNKPKRVRLEV